MATPTDFDSGQINSGLTGKLVGFVVGSTVALKWELHTVLNATPSAVIMTGFTQAGKTEIITLPSKEFVTQVEDVTAGFDGFRIVINNLDPSEAADVHVTFLYDEV